jgi:hypothetical protein
MEMGNPANADLVGFGFYSYYQHEKEYKIREIKFNKVFFTLFNVHL